MRSAFGYCFTFGSTAEAEFVAAAAAVNQALWLRQIMMDLQLEQEEYTEIFVENQAAIVIPQNPVCHRITKHFNIKFYFLREEQKNGEMMLVYFKTENQVPNIFTKSFHVNSLNFSEQN